MSIPVVSLAVMAHPNRATMAEQVSEQLGGAPIVWDQIGDRWDTRRRTLQAASANADWHVMIQDDAIVPPNLVEHLPRILTHIPPRMWASFYLGNTPFAMETQAMAKRADRAVVSWVQFRRVVWGVAIAIPTSDIADAIRAGDRQNDRLEDRRLGKFVAGRRDGCWHTWPSLVDHTQGPSITDTRSETRHAYRTGDPAEFDPAGPVIRHLK